ncbi:hypothetical protein BDN71DRAFT_1504625 [Pleurotus eryngii]|uniref:Uncharacterized protein n=1 Tax=Pleurotus eryngii TaxID=5323 RepID=A0A9P6A229_PLEER|nr:hypothetical protein BDN71DRAFT_1504625 [Pleurotus eryngii]
MELLVLTYLQMYFQANNIFWIIQPGRRKKYHNYGNTLPPATDSPTSTNPIPKKQVKSQAAHLYPCPLFNDCATTEGLAQQASSTTRQNAHIAHSQALAIDTAISKDIADVENDSDHWKDDMEEKSEEKGDLYEDEEDELDDDDKGGQTDQEQAIVVSHDLQKGLIWSSQSIATPKGEDFSEGEDRDVEDEGMDVNNVIQQPKKAMWQKKIDKEPLSLSIPTSTLWCLLKLHLQWSHGIPTPTSISPLLAVKVQNSTYVCNQKIIQWLQEEDPKIYWQPILDYHFHQLSLKQGLIHKTIYQLVTVYYKHLDNPNILKITRNYTKHPSLPLPSKWPFYNDGVGKHNPNSFSSTLEHAKDKHEVSPFMVALIITMVKIWLHELQTGSNTIIKLKGTTRIEPYQCHMDSLFEMLHLKPTLYHKLMHKLFIEVGGSKSTSTSLHDEVVANLDLEIMEVSD